jgi:hypothetical protein
MVKVNPRGMLTGHYGLGAMALKTDGRISPWVHAGVIGAGVVLGYVSYPYSQQPLGMMLMGASGSVIAVGLLLLAYDLFRNKGVVQPD